MPILVFNACCGSIKLRSASLAIGYLQLVLEFSLAAFLVLMLAFGSAAASGAIKSPDATDAQVKALGAATIVVSVILLLTTALAIGFTILLLIGVHRKRRGYVMVYLIATAIYLVTDVITILVHSRSSLFYKILELLICALNVYFWLVVRSYYYKMNTR